MSKLKTAEIEALAQSKGFTLIDDSNYKNLNSMIRVQCSNNHLVETSVSMLRKATFRCPNCEGEQTSNFTDAKMPPEKEGYRIIALDQASNKIGVSIYDNGRLVYFNLIEVTGTLERRMTKIYDFITTVVIEMWKPDYLVFEDIQMQKDNVHTFKVLAYILGICILAAEKYKIEHTEVLNKRWQEEFYIGGAQREAQKKEVMQRVKEYYKVDVTDDVADAILIGRYAASKLSHKWFKSDF